MSSLGFIGPYTPMSKEKALEWLKNLNEEVEGIAVGNEEEFQVMGEYPCLPEHNETLPYEELFFLAADGS